MNGYKQAGLIDEQINALLKKEDITKENALAWLNFTRTVSSGLGIIAKEASRKWKEENS